MDEYTCSLRGNADMYGLGIRLGFYIQWLAGAIAALLRVERDAVAARSAIFGFSLATFVAVVVQTATSTNTAIDIYIPLLLCFGFFYSLPAIHYWTTYFWRKNDNSLNPTVVVASREFDILQMTLLLAVSGLKLWFWATRVLQSNNRPECLEYGFLFCRLELKDNAMRSVNICIDCGMIFFFIWKLYKMINSSKPLEQALPNEKEEDIK
ncbi:hypothetical protein C8A03DRAFT_19841 [Achaetomium macrosporum]|uniref:Uncharacterized protein n=1 Tax=Achaetomium macrosporum TaxID=79813 RepID=A0AAN7C0V4_9PEZI|nr:hypothetical protein C8A03DRAFT_19841 [Achaetomium macrosporum]